MKNKEEKEKILVNRMQPRVKLSSKSISSSKHDALTKSPVSGAYILKKWSKKMTYNNTNNNDLNDLNRMAAKCVDRTPQARSKLSKIVNNIGPFECKLCQVIYVDAFELAMHNCPRFVHLEYKCSQCEKVFNCPANLASHKRWHVKRVSTEKESTFESSSRSSSLPSKMKTKINQIEEKNDEEFRSNANGDQLVVNIWQTYSDILRTASSSSSSVASSPSTFSSLNYLQLYQPYHYYYYYSHYGSQISANYDNYAVVNANSIYLQQKQQQQNDLFTKMYYSNYLSSSFFSNAKN